MAQFLGRQLVSFPLRLIFQAGWSVELKPLRRPSELLWNSNEWCMRPSRQPRNGLRTQLLKAFGRDGREAYATPPLLSRDTLSIDEDARRDKRKEWNHRNLCRANFFFFFFRLAFRTNGAMYFRGVCEPDEATPTSSSSSSSQQECGSSHSQAYCNCCCCTAWRIQI